MRGRWLHFLALCVVFLGAKAAAAAPLTVASSAIGPEGRIALANSAYGDNLSPPMRWSPTAGAKSHAVVIVDPDAPAGRPFVH